MVAVQWTSIVWIVCSALFGIMPSAAYQMMSTSFHMARFAEVADPRLTYGGFFLGLIMWNIIAYLGVQLFVWLWNHSNETK